MIHAVGPVWEGGHKGEDRLLASCYSVSLEIARAHQVKTIAFPAISCGAYRFPVPRAARIVLEALDGAISNYPELESLTIVAFDAVIENAFVKAAALMASRPRR